MCLCLVGGSGPVMKMVQELTAELGSKAEELKRTKEELGGQNAYLMSALDASAEQKLNVNKV